jgi:arsenate reductase
MPNKILILCTGNSCRSQMAEAFLKSFDPTLEVSSAGTNPSSRVHPKAIQVMNEVGISLDGAFPKNVDRFINEPFDYVITVCDNAKETCPVFVGHVKHRLHIGFDDPAEAQGTDEEVLAVFRRVRDEIREKFWEFYTQSLREHHQS